MTTTDLAERYGTAPTWRRRALLGVVGVVVLAFAGWLAWAGWIQSDPDVASGDLTYDASTATDRQITASFTVDIADGVDEATCVLEAQAKDHTTVGRVTFLVPHGTTRVEKAIATDRRAVTVVLVGCTAPGQKRPR